MVDKNTNAFRERFRRWKNGELVYDKGRPIELSEYGGGKDSNVLDEYSFAPQMMNEVVVLGYSPIRLSTYYPLTSEYPFTGHSKLEVPIDQESWEKHTGDTAYHNKGLSYLTIDKNGLAEDYNLLNNNCSNETLSFLNKVFNTEEHPHFFTTPGDVQDYAIKKLGGKLYKDEENGKQIVLIPRNGENYKNISQLALDYIDNTERRGNYSVTKRPFRIHVNKNRRLLPYLYRGGKDSNVFDEFRENHPTVSTVASFLPVIGTAMDVYDAYKDPTAKNIGYAALSAATDIIGGKIIAKAVGQSIKRAKLIKKFAKEALEEMRGWEYYKNMNNAKDAERSIKNIARQEAERKAESLGYGADDYADGLLRTIVPSAVYAPDALANLSLNGFKNGKDSIRIKPSHRGRLTALKKRTGKSEAELWKTGGPSVRKMITFARNARKWKH